MREILESSSSDEEDGGETGSNDDEEQKGEQKEEEVVVSILVVFLQYVLTKYTATVICLLYNIAPQIITSKTTAFAFFNLALSRFSGNPICFKTLEILIRYIWRISS